MFEILLIFSFLVLCGICFFGGYFFRKMKGKKKGNNPDWAYYWEEGYNVGHTKGYKNGRTQGLKDFIEP